MPSSVLRSVPPEHRIPALDGLRAASIALVLVGHLAGTRHFLSSSSMQIFGDVGNLGVSIFFVISGFLITTLLLKEQAETGRIRLGAFYARRTFRIVPAAGVYLLTLAIAAMTSAAIRVPPTDWVRALTFTMNYHQARTWWLGHLWSLSVEEQFYLVWPAAMVVLGRRLSLWMASSAVAIAPFCRMAAWWLWPDARDAIGETFPTVMDAIAVGCVLAGSAEWLARQAWYRRVLASPPFLAAPALVVICNTLDRHPSFFLTAGMTLRSLGIAVIVHWAILRSHRIAAALLDAPPIAFIGRISYSLYLWQQPFLNRHSGALVAAFPINIACALGCALASFVFVEAPARRVRERVIGRLRALARHWDLDLLLLTYLFIPRKLLRDTVRQFGARLDGRMLDVGCGSQQYRKFVACHHYVGVEWSLHKRPPVVADVTRIPFGDRAFDSALCTEVLEHLPEPGRCLAEIHRVVKPGGTVLFTVPMTMYTHSEPYDFYRYTEYGLRYLLEKHGFEIVEVRRLGGVLSVMASHAISLGCDAVVDRLERRGLGRAGRALLLPIAVSASLLFYAASRVVDQLDRQDAIGWAAMCRTTQAPDASFVGFPADDAS